MRIIGMDTALTHFGVVVLDSEPKMTPLRAAVFKTQPLAKPKSKMDDLSARVRYLFRAVKLFCDRDGVPDVVCVEAPIIKGRFDAKMAIARLHRVRGIVDAMAEVWNVPIMEVMPSVALSILTGSKSNDEGDKMIMQRTVESLLPEVKLVYPTYVSDVEHVCDAAGIVLACFRSAIQKNNER